MVRFGARKRKLRISFFSNWFKSIGLRIANYLSKQEKKLSFYQRKVFFFCFFGILGAFLVYITVSSVLSFNSKKGNKTGKVDKVDKTDKKGFSFGSIKAVSLLNSSSGISKERIKRDEESAKEDEKQILLIIKYLDSLKMSPDHSMYDDILKGNPGLIDSLEYIRRNLAN